MTNKRLRKAITEYIENLEKNLFKELDEENFDLANELYDTSKLKELLAETAPASLTSKEKAKYAMAMSDAMDELKPCPFCGSEAKTHSHLSIGEDSSGGWCAICQNEEGDCNARIPYCRTKAEAVTQWNTRHETSTPTPKCEQSEAIPEIKHRYFLEWLKSDTMDEAREIIDNLIWDMWTTDGIGEGFTADEEDHLAQATAFLAKYKRTDR